MKDKRYIFVTGGCNSSSGKGVTSASIGCVLETFGYKVSFRKLDGYLNKNAGTMNPEQHGEVYVLDDGSETDLDLGHYHRFTNVKLDKYCNVTMGSVYLEVVNKDITGEYDGDCVQVIPHVTDVIKQRITENHDPDTDFVIVEVGGTIGDMENMSMVDAISQLKNDLGEKKVCYAHLVFISYIQAAAEWKTKPAQHSVATLKSLGINPDVLLCRIENEVPKDKRKAIKSKLAQRCHVKEDMVAYMDDVKSVYEIPVNHWETFAHMFLNHFGLEHSHSYRNTEWVDKVSRINIKVGKTVRVGIFGKYTNVRDSYKSIHESLNHASIRLGLDLDVQYYSSTEEINCDAILIPGGFGSRGIDVKEQAFLAAYYYGMPCLGLCLGLQTSVVSFAKRICKIDDASYEEFADEMPGKFLVCKMESQKSISDRSGTMRLGSMPSYIVNSDSMFCKSYLKWGNSMNQISKTNDGKLYINERHRHRYEINPDYIDILEENGMTVVARNENGLVEAMEIKNSDSNVWFIGVQYHPEYKSQFVNPHPLFVEFLDRIK